MAVSADPEPTRRWQIGDLVTVRRQRWRIVGIDDEPACRTLTLSGLGPYNLDDQRQLLEPFERIEGETPVPARHDADDVPVRWAGGPRRWRQAWRDVLHGLGPWAALRSADDRTFAVMPHQLEPALAVLAGDASRVLLADGVGLGKTLQAALLLAELLRRGAARCALVLTPAGLRDQWRSELERHVAVAADVIDLRSALQRATDLPVGVSPWSLLRVAIASIDFVKRAETLPAVRARGWDVVIVDEAHLVTPGSDRFAALSQLCELATWVLLLTATPHSGDRAAYQALLALGRHDDDCLVFRRGREDVHLAARRRQHYLAVRTTAAEARMHAALDRYAAAVRAEQGEAVQVNLLLSVLRKRALSSPVSLLRSIERRLILLGGEAAGGADAGDRQLRLPLDDSGEFDGSDAAPELDGPALRDIRRERQLLRRLAQLAAAAATHEVKLAALARLLRRLGERGEPVVVFTEYRDTLAHLQANVAPAALLLHGGLARPERNAAIDAFTRGDGLVLLATDAAGEGLNLHARCRCVVHLEVPWNPVRLEQRTGRVDRIGQARTVHAFHLVSRQPAEAHLLQRLRWKAACAAADVEPVAAHAAGAGRAVAGRAEAARILRARSCRRYRPRASRVQRYAGGRGAGGGIGGRRPRGTWTVARPRLRLHLRGRALVIAERVLRDADGQRLAASLEAWWLPARPLSGGRPALSGRWPAGPEVQAWYAAESAVRDRFWARARARARAIADAHRQAAADLFQPGLFDRRADRRRQLRLDERQALFEAAHARVRRLDALHTPVALVGGRWLLVRP